MSGPDQRARRRGSGRSVGRLLGYGSLTLVALAAAALAVGSEDARLLRLGLVAALWAGLIGAIAAVRTRRELTMGSERAEDLHRIYRLELEREVAARREHEVNVERDLRREVQQQSRDEIDALRAELRTLRENLESLLGGELLVERVALQAQSTRLRSLPERAAPDRTVAVTALSSQQTVTGGPAGAGDAGPRSGEQSWRATPALAHSAAAVTPPARPAAHREDTPTGPTIRATPPPHRDPAARTGAGRPPRDAEAERIASSFAEDPLFGDAPWRSTKTWTPSWQAEPTPWERAGSPAPAGHPAESPGNRTQRAEPPSSGHHRQARSDPGSGRHHVAGSSRQQAPATVAPGGTDTWRSGTDDAAGEGVRRRVPEPAQGAHSGPRSVGDLLAAYGAPSASRRRRRVEED